MTSCTLSSPHHLSRPRTVSMRVEAATKQFGSDRPALDGVSFELGAGEFTVLLGPSGSGKSTLLRAAVGLVDLTSGRITIAAQNKKAVRPHRTPAIAMVHQDGSLTDRLTAIQNVLSAMAPTVGWHRVLFQAYPRPMQRKAFRLLERVGLTEVEASRPARELSGGQRQRVGIARALMNDPALILADEPVASLDPATARNIMALLQETAREQGASVLCSLHQIDLACEFADRIIALKDGKLVIDENGDELSPKMLTGLFGKATDDQAFNVVGG